MNRRVKRTRGGLNRSLREGAYGDGRANTEADLRGGATGNKDSAAKVGALLADRAKTAGVTKVVFDRGGFQYHGRVAAVADAAREKGLEF